MQNTQQNTSFSELVTNKVWAFMTQLRGTFPIEELFTHSLALLYALHKGYHINVINNHHLEFVLNDDKLYRDLIQFVPDDKLLHAAMCKFLNEISPIDCEEFNRIYVDVLRRLFDMVSCNAGKGTGEFFTPVAITKLMAYIIDKEECNEVFDPFCGTASLIHEMAQFGGLPLFTGQEINHKTSIYARVNAEAFYRHDECIKNVDSIHSWDDYTYDAVVSCPPLRVRLSSEDLAIAKRATPQCSCLCYEDIILTRPFLCNQARLTITHLDTGFCYRGGRDKELRSELVERGVVDSVIALPSGILYGTSIPTIILVCKKERRQDEPIKFIHAENYVIGDRRKRTFDYKRFIDMLESDARDVVKVPVDEVRQYDYNLNPALYYTSTTNLKVGQRLCRLGDLITLAHGVHIPSSAVQGAVSLRLLSRDFIEILLNNSKTESRIANRGNMPCRSFTDPSAKYLIASFIAGESRYGINTDGKGMVCTSNIRAFKINEDLVTPEYLVYALTHHKALSQGITPLTDCLMLPIVIDSPEVQKELVNKEVQRYNQKAEIEREADAKRLGVKQNISDLEHMLGSIQLRINKIITRLEKATPASANYPHLVKSMKDNVEYMNRVIKYNNARIDAESFNIIEGNIVEFISQYVDAWNNYGGEYFELTIENRLQDNVEMSFDKSFLTVMLDAILNNAIRHGFHKRKNYTEHNAVQITLSVTEYKGKPYLLLSVANNGDPIPDGFTIDDYISRGRYAASTGRSGLGGHHVYQIAKGHGGFLYLDSNKVWSTIVDVLIPISSIGLTDIPSYDNECI